LAEHRRVLREAFERHAGVEVDTQGDAFFVAFARAKDAIVTLASIG
jgi:class 3 adenylate cyclase